MLHSYFQVSTLPARYYTGFLLTVIVLLYCSRQAQQDEETAFLRSIVLQARKKAMGRGGAGPSSSSTLAMKRSLSPMGSKAATGPQLDGSAKLSSLKRPLVSRQPSSTTARSLTQVATSGVNKSSQKRGLSQTYAGPGGKSGGNPQLLAPFKGRGYGLVATMRAALEEARRLEIADAHISDSEEDMSNLEDDHISSTKSSGDSDADDPFASVRSQPHEPGFTQRALDADIKLVADLNERCFDEEVDVAPNSAREEQPIVPVGINC